MQCHILAMVLAVTLNHKNITVQLVFRPRLHMLKSDWSKTMSIILYNLYDSRC